MFLLSRIFLLDLLIISFLRDGIVDEVMVFLIEIGMEKLAWWSFVAVWIFAVPLGSRRMAG